MSVTRLLVLGVVRIFEPAHGYLVRRELLSWQVEEWANVKPGSIYNALRTLTRDGLLLEEEAPIAIGGTGPAARATYRLTPEGQSEFFRLERRRCGSLHPGEPGWLLAGLSFWFTLSREEVLAALAARRAQLKSRLAGTPYLVQEVDESDKPRHVASTSTSWRRTCAPSSTGSTRPRPASGRAPTASPARTRRSSARACPRTRYSEFDW